MKFLCVWLALCVCGWTSYAQETGLSADGLLPEQQVVDTSSPKLTLGEIEQKAMIGNPEIRVAVKQLATIETQVRAAGALDDPSFMYRAWGVPLRQPWNYNSAQNMFMVGQTLPWFGKRDLRSDIAQSDVAIAKAALDNTRLQVRIGVRKAFYDLLRTQDEMRIHDEHVAIARQAVDAAKIKYTVGRVPQQDILKAQVALTRLAEHIIHFEQDADVARSRLNALMGRDPAHPIRVSGEYSIPEPLPATADLEKVALQARPDLAQAQAEIKKSEQERALAGKAYQPDVTVSGGYMLMPRGSEQRNNYMLEGSINLPWLNRRKHDSEIEEAKARVSEQEAEYEALESAAFDQIQEAMAQAKASKRLADVYGNSLKKQSEATLRSTVIAYENNHTDFLNLLDSQNAVIDIDLAYYQALADFETRFADLELAVGAPIDRNPTQKAPEVTK